MPKTIICKYCGSECTDQDEYCPKCLKRIPEEKLDKSNIIDGMSEHDIFVFVENDADYYLQTFKKHNNKKVFVSFNFAAFFFGPLWMVYRKMHIEAIVAYLITTLISFACVAGILISTAPEFIYRYLFYDFWYESCASFIENIDYTKYVILFQFVLPYFISGIFYGLFGNAIYKGYVKRHIKSLADGGTLFLAIFAALFAKFAIDLLMRLLVFPIGENIVRFILDLL
ncbi:MAG: DUF2628 domain-containing protein [Clostridia bacterium]|nr:DUF2628 domain-containing protein [Clostridia bacterium]